MIWYFSLNTVYYTFGLGSESFSFFSKKWIFHPEGFGLGPRACFLLLPCAGHYERKVYINRKLVSSLRFTRGQFHVTETWTSVEMQNNSSATTATIKRSQHVTVLAVRTLQSLHSKESQVQKEPQPNWRSWNKIVGFHSVCSPQCIQYIMHTYIYVSTNCLSL